MTRSKTIASILLASFMLVGCASINGLPVPGTMKGATTEEQLKELSQYTQADLAVAEADAIANHDTISAPCYPALTKFIQSIPGQSTVGGAFTAFQKARDVRNFALGGLPDYITIGCGPLYAQVHGDLLAFLALVAPAPK